MRSYTHCFYMVVMSRSFAQRVLCATLLCVCVLFVYLFASSSVECTNVCLIFFCSHSLERQICPWRYCAKRDEEKQHLHPIGIGCDKDNDDSPSCYVPLFLVRLSFVLCCANFFLRFYCLSDFITHIFFGYKDIGVYIVDMCSVPLKKFAKHLQQYKPCIHRIG